MNSFQAKFNDAQDAFREFRKWEREFLKCDEHTPFATVQKLYHRAEWYSATVNRLCADLTLEHSRKVQHKLYANWDSQEHEARAVIRTLQNEKDKLMIELQKAYQPLISRGDNSHNDEVAIDEARSA